MTIDLTKLTIEINVIVVFFWRLIREKETVARERKRVEEEEKAKEENEELMKARRTLVHKAQPVLCPKPFVIKKSDKRPTNPRTPQFQRSRSASLRTNKYCDN